MVLSLAVAQPWARLTGLILYVFVENAQTTAALGTLVAATMAWRGVAATKRAAHGQLYASMRWHYSGRIMLWDLKWLTLCRKLKDAGGNRWHDWEVGYISKRLQPLERAEALYNKDDEPDVWRVDEARRRVSHFYLTAAELRAKKAISARLLRDLCADAAFDLVYAIVEHLEVLTGISLAEQDGRVLSARGEAPYNRQAFDRLLKKCGRCAWQARALERGRPDWRTIVCRFSDGARPITTTAKETSTK